MLLRLFQHQVARHCTFVLMAADDAQLALNDMQRWRSCAHCTERFWYSAQSLLGAAANVSKALWGGGRGQKAIEARRTPLRVSLAVEDDSPLKLKDLRNHLEHFDERLEEWLTRSERKWHIDGGFGDPRAPGFIDPPPEPVEVFRNYNPATGELTFWGDTVLLPQLVAAAGELLAKAQAEAAKPHWEPPPSTSGAG